MSPASRVGYYGVFAGGLAGLATLLWARRDRAYWTAIACAVVTLAAVVLPVWLPYARDRAAAGPMRTTTLEELRGFAANWRDYVTSGTMGAGALLDAVGGLGRRVWPQMKVARANEVLFPGVVISSLAVVGLVAARRLRSDRRILLAYALFAIAAIWASFGPDGGLYRILTIVPGAGLLRAPARLGVVAIFALAVLAGFGVRRLGLSRPWLAPLLLAALIGELWVPWPLQAMPAPARAYRMLAQLPPGGVIEFPFPYISTIYYEHTKAMTRSMINWQPLVNGYSDFIPPDFDQMAVPVNGFPDPASFEILRAHRVRYVVVRLVDYGNPEYRQSLLARFPPYAKYLRRITDDHDVWLYEIVRWPGAEAGASENFR